MAPQYQHAPGRAKNPHAIEVCKATPSPQGYLSETGQWPNFVNISRGKAAAARRCARRAQGVALAALRRGGVGGPGVRSEVAPAGRAGTIFRRAPESGPQKYKGEKVMTTKEVPNLVNIRRAAEQESVNEPALRQLKNSTAFQCRIIASAATYDSPSMPCASGREVSDD